MFYRGHLKIIFYLNLNVPLLCWEVQCGGSSASVLEWKDRQEVFLGLSMQNAENEHRLVKESMLLKINYVSDTGGIFVTLVSVSSASQIDKL